MRSSGPQNPEMCRGWGRSGSTRNDGDALRFRPSREQRAEVALEHLLHQVERIHDLADLDDAAVAQRVEHRDVELHDAAAVALLEERAQAGCYLVALRNDLAHLV